MTRLVTVSSAICNCATRIVIVNVTSGKVIGCCSMAMAGAQVAPSSTEDSLIAEINQVHCNAALSHPRGSQDLGAKVASADVLTCKHRITVPIIAMWATRVYHPHES